MKTATCDMKVPAILSPTGEAIEVGTTLNYKRTKFSNGEDLLVLADGKTVPAIFFDI